MSDKGVKFVIGIYDDEDILLDAISSVRGKGVNIHEVYSPFPVPVSYTHLTLPTKLTV